MALIGAEVREFCAECFPPHDGIAAISRMAEIERTIHFGNEATDELRIAAKAVAGKDKSCTADTFAHAVAAQNLHAADAAVGLRQQHIGNASRQDGGVGGV